MKRIICWLFGHKERISVIKKGRKITVDKGVIGIDKGTFISTNGWSLGGLYGKYKDEQGKIRVWDLSAHKVYPVRLTNWEIYLKAHCPRCGKQLK